MSDDRVTRVSVRVLDREYQVACPAEERSDLLVLLQEVGPLGDQVVLAVAQRAVLFLELLHGGDELVQSALEAAQLGIDR